MPSVALSFLFDVNYPYRIINHDVVFRALKNHPGITPGITSERTEEDMIG